MYPCTSCDKSYAWPQMLKEHLKKVHDIKGTLVYTNMHKCRFCDKASSRPSSLKDHESKEHGVKGKYGCEICNKQFYVKDEYKKHVDVHTGVKPYKCRYCEKSFGSTSNRSTHEKGQHTNTMGGAPCVKNGHFYRSSSPPRRCRGELFYL